MQHSGKGGNFLRAGLQKSIQQCIYLPRRCLAVLSGHSGWKAAFSLWPAQATPIVSTWPRARADAQFALACGEGDIFHVNVDRGHFPACCADSHATTYPARFAGQGGILPPSPVSFNQSDSPMCDLPTPPHLTRAAAFAGRRVGRGCKAAYSFSSVTGRGCGTETLVLSCELKIVALTETRGRGRDPRPCCDLWGTP